MEWMEMDARTVHSTGWTEWTVDVEWIATLVVRCEDRIIVSPCERIEATNDLDINLGTMEILVGISIRVFGLLLMYHQPLDRDGSHEWGLPSDIESE